MAGQINNENKVLFTCDLAREKERLEAPWCHFWDGAA